MPNSALASLVINTRTMLDDIRAAKFTNVQVGYFLNEAARVVQGQLKVAKIRRSFSLVADQRAYTLDDELDEIVDMIYREGEEHIVLEGRSLDDFHRMRTTFATRPYAYTYLDSERSIMLWPTPDTASGADQLNGAVNSTVTTFTLDSTADFPTQGRGTIESEVFEWNDKTSTTLTGITRALEGTTAATHADNTAVTAREMLVYGTQRFRGREMNTIYTTGNINPTNASAVVSGGASAPSWTNNLLPGDLIGLTSDATRIDPQIWYEILTVDSATQVTLTETYKQPSSTNQTYIASAQCPLPQWCDPLLISYACAMLLKREGDARLSGAHMGDFELGLRKAKQKYAKSDTVIHPIGERDRGRSRSRDGGLVWVYDQLR